ncbi:kinase-like domain-containing protein [Podospora didyma]|uniref:EKC/KEOPS complex subunit BUD32 n=1 Tax=Podospora didyma TaxID=330526 RepID=A0AAE0K0S0_9PEZI|nr:kinase-like domain-containing protein [Podospora didyma]
MTRPYGGRLFKPTPTPPVQPYTVIGAKDARYEIVEKIDQYEPGEGFLPVHINDRLGEDGDGRYRVINKLGSGSYGTVWLCEDLDPQQPGECRWKAVKITMCSDGGIESGLAEKRIRRDVMERCRCAPAQAFEIGLGIPSDYFEIVRDGGREVYCCLVSPILRGEISEECFYLSRNDPKLLDFCYNAALAMQSLHKMEIVHGDFRSTNILVQLPGMDKLTLHDIKQIWGKPRVIMTEGKPNDHYPAYLAVAARPDYEKLKECLQVYYGDKGEELLDQPKIAVVDFGGSWNPKQKRKKSTFIPTAYSSPESYSDTYYVSFESDIWALGCAIFYLLTKKDPFCHGIAGAPHMGDLMREWEEFIGTPYPNSKVRAATLEDAMRQRVTRKMADWRKTKREAIDKTGARSYLEAALLVAGIYPPAVADWVDLFKRIFTWRPEHRIKIEDIINHTVFEHCREDEPEKAYPFDK